MEAITKSTSDPDVKKGEELEQARQQLKIFGELLTKCFSLETRRWHYNGKGSFDSPGYQEIRRFCNQAMSDSKYLVLGRLPDDIVQTLREAIKKKKEVKA